MFLNIFADYSGKSFFKNLIEPAKAPPKPMTIKMANSQIQLRDITASG